MNLLKKILRLLSVYEQNKLHFNLLSQEFWTHPVSISVYEYSYLYFSFYVYVKRVALS